MRWLEEKQLSHPLHHQLLPPRAPPVQPSWHQRCSGASWWAGAIWETNNPDPFAPRSTAKTTAWLQP